MATDTFTASIPFVTLSPGMTIKFEAISPTTGAAITGVTITDVAIYATDVGAPTDLLSGPYMLVPGPAA